MESRTAEADPGSAGRRVTTRTWWLISTEITVAALILAGVLAWQSVAASAADEVDVWTGPPRCQGVLGVRTAHGESGPQQIVMLGKGTEAKDFRCTVTVFVANRSGRTLHLDRVVLPIMGPRGGAVVRVDSTGDPSIWSHEGGDIDAVQELDLDVGGGDRTSFQVDYVFRPGGCTTSGTQWTRAELLASVLGREVALPAPHAFAFSHSGRTPGCRLLD